jgi:hypothetical protein
VARQDNWKGDAEVPHNKLLASIGDAMDIPMDAFGEGSS